jgi:lysyl-tRNA synthetase class 2
VSAGFKKVEELLEMKSTQVHQKLNGFRKKNKLDIPALQLEDVKKWFEGKD